MHFQMESSSLRKQFKYVLIITIRSNSGNYTEPKQEEQKRWIQTSQKQLSDLVHNDEKLSSILAVVSLE